MRVKLLPLGAQQVGRPHDTLVETVGVLVWGVYAHVFGGLLRRHGGLGGARLGGDGHGRQVGVGGGSLGRRGLWIERNGDVLEVIGAVCGTQRPEEDVFGRVLNGHEVIRVPGLPHTYGMGFGGVDGGGYHSAIAWRMDLPGSRGS